jgi:hypothetical protein
MRTLSTNPKEQTGPSLAAPNGTNQSDLTPPDAGPLYKHPTHHPALGFPRPRHGNRKVPTVAVHRNWRHRHDGLEVGVAASIPFVPPSSTQTRYEGTIIGTAEVTGILYPDAPPQRRWSSPRCHHIRFDSRFDFVLHRLDWIRPHADLIWAFVGEPPCADLIWAGRVRGWRRPDIWAMVERRRLHKLL